MTSLELTGKEILEMGNIPAFEEFILNNSDKLNFEYSFEEGLTFPMILVQIFRKAESLVIDRSNKVVVDVYKHCLNVLVEFGCDLDAQDANGRTFAHWTILLHCLELLSVALGLGCNCMLQDSEGETIVHLSIRYNDQMALETIKLYANNSDVFESPSETSGATPLIYAVQIGAVDIVQKLLQLLVNVDAQENNKYKRTALHYSMFTDNEEIFTLLLKNKARSDIKDYKDKCVLDRVAEHPKDNFLRILTHYSSSEIFSTSSGNSSNTMGYSPIIIACKNNDYSMLCDLIEKEKEQNNKVNLLIEDSEMRTPLHHCADNSDMKCAEALIELQPDLISRKDKNGFNVLHLATIANNIKLVQLLIKNGSDIKEKDNDGHTCLHWAVVCCAIELIDIFMKTDSAILSIIDNHGASPLHYATQSFLSPEGSIQGPIVIEKLLRNNKDDINCVDYDNRTPLLWAASLGITDCCQILLENGADINHRDNNGLSVLHCAASRGNYDVIDLLVTTWSMPVDIQDNNLCTPLFYAVTLKHMSIIHFLVEQRSNPNQQDIKGRSVAHCAALKGYCDVLDLIRKIGGSLTLKNKNGDLPLHEAAETGKTEVCELLLEKMNECDEIHLIDSLNIKGFSALHKASQNNHFKICKFLLSNGANINLFTKPDPNIKGKTLEFSNLTALDLAKDSAVINLLKDMNGKHSKDLIENVSIEYDKTDENIESSLGMDNALSVGLIPKENIQSIDTKKDDDPSQNSKATERQQSGSTKKSNKSDTSNKQMKPKGRRNESNQSKQKINRKSSGHKQLDHKKSTDNLSGLTNAKLLNNSAEDQNDPKKQDKMNEFIKEEKSIKTNNIKNAEISINNDESLSHSLKQEHKNDEDQTNVEVDKNLVEVKEVIQKANSVNKLELSRNVKILNKNNNNNEKNKTKPKMDDLKMVDKDYDKEKNEKREINDKIEILKTTRVKSSKRSDYTQNSDNVGENAIDLNNYKIKPNRFVKSSLNNSKNEKEKSSKVKSNIEVIENGIEIKANLLNYASQESYPTTTTSSISSRTSDIRKPNKSKPNDLSSRVVESVREYERVRQQMRSMSDQRRMEMFQGYNKSIQLKKMTKRKTLASAKSKQSIDEMSNNIELPELTLYDTNYFQNTEKTKSRTIFPISRSKDELIRSAYDYQSSVNSLTLY